MQMGSVLKSPRLSRLVKTMRTTRAPIKAILYDLDGTLVDNFGAIHRSIAHAQQQLGVPGLLFEKVRATVGGGIEVTLARPRRPRTRPQGHSLLSRVFAKNHVRGSPPPARRRLVDGTTCMQRGFRQGVLTNKQGDFARAITHHLGWDKWLDHVFGTFDINPTWRKPAREFTLHAVDRTRRRPRRKPCMIGDSPFDIEAAVNAGLQSQVVATGSHTREQLLAHQPAPDAVFANLHELGVATFGLKTDH